MTTTEMWQAVGLELQRARLARRWSLRDVEHAGGPAYQTVKAIEAGAAGTVTSLDKCATALNLSIVAILRAVITSRAAPLSPEAAHLLHQFAKMTIAQRAAMVQVASVLADAV